MSKTGLVFDERMQEHKCTWDSAYPESPERLQVCIDLLESSGTTARCTRVSSREATETEIESLHSKDHLQTLEMTKVCEDLEELSAQYDSVYFNEATSQAAKLAAGSSIKLTEEVLLGTVRNGFALVRPPGHHAMHNDFCGYSFINNAALAAYTAVHKFNLDRVLIVDWDVHHGQGTQRMFYNEKRVMYFSIHRYEHAKFWPHLRESHYDFIGTGSGLGYNINVPLNTTDCGDLDYLHIFDEILMPIAEQYNPQLVIISAGFDSALGDPKGGMNVTPQGYAHLTSQLMRLAGGKIVAILEGGYCLDALSYGVLGTVRTLLGDELPLLPNLEAGLRVEKSVEEQKIVFGKYWNLGNLARHISDPQISTIEENVSNHISDGPPFPTREFHGSPFCSPEARLALNTVIRHLTDFYGLATLPQNLKKNCDALTY